MKKHDYYDFNQQYYEPKESCCRLCRSKDVLIYREHLALTPDDFPFFPYHMLLLPIKPNRTGGKAIAVDRNVSLGYVSKNQLDCREHFICKDIELISHLVLETDYIVTQSMRGSGASVPEHIHAHAFKKKETRFPLLNRRYFNIELIHGFVTVFVTKQPSYAIAIQGEPSDIGHIFTRLHDCFGYASNHVFSVDNSFGGLVGVYTPRIREIPQGKMFEDWKFGAFEVLGLFDVKKPKWYDVLRFDDLYGAIQDVTLQDKKTQQEMEEFIVSIIKSDC